jgi:phage tail-like protein
VAGEFEFRLRQLDVENPIELILAIGRTTVGRQPGNTLHLDSDMVSRQHAILICSQLECRIIDDNSQNGTRVNNERIEPNVPKLLTHNAIVEFAGIRFVFEQISIGADVVAAPFGVAPVFPSAPASWEPPRQNGDGQSAYTLLPGLSRYGYHLLKYLPDIYYPDYVVPGEDEGNRTDDFMARLMGLFESILMPISWTIDNFDVYLHSDTAPAEFLPWLGSWFGIHFDSTWNENQQRMILREAHWLYTRQGTRQALSRILEIYLGEIPDILEYIDDKQPYFFGVRVSKRHTERRQLIEAIINANKPAYTIYKLEFV